jgi:hypothetical protein
VASRRGPRTLPDPSQAQSRWRVAASDAYRAQ